MNYNIIATGSKGNAVQIEKEILIDCGIPYKKLEEAHIIHDIELVLLTHEHSDHFNKKTIKRLSNERPTLRFGCCEWMLPLLDEIKIPRHLIDLFKPNNGKRYKRKYSVFPVMLHHNVPNCGWSIMYNSERVLYATDTASLNGVEAPEYDLYLIEGNYTKEDIKKRIARKKAAGEYAYEEFAEYNHLSKEDALKWLGENANTNSVYRLMHGHEEK